MRASYLIFFLSLKVFSQTAPQIEVIPTPKNLEDFDHQFKGCLENSECDQVMGLQLTRWKDLISKVKDEKIEASKKIQFLELFRDKYGIPVEFYTLQKSQTSFKPLLYNSPCKDHNPKAPEPKILRGISFVKSLSKSKATVWRDQTQMEVAVGETFEPQPVTVYYDKGPETYYLPLGDQPVFIKNKDMYVIKEEDGLFFALKISPAGDWKIENIDFTRLSEWEDKKQEVTCPKEKTKLAPKIFGTEFCRTVWDEDLKKPVITRYYQGCAI